MVAIRLDEPALRLMAGLAALPPILAGGVLGALAGLLVNPLLALLPLAAVSLLALGGLAGIRPMPGGWSFLALSAAVAGSVVAFRRMLAAREARGIVRGSMGGVVGEPVLRQLIRRPHLFETRDRGASITCMSIDIVGFATMASAFPPAVVFPRLRQLQEMIGEVAHRHGGMVDRGFRDGFSCFFGKQLLRDGPVGMHAEMALSCAIELQRRGVFLVLDAARHKHPVFVMRIGIETALASIGSLAVAGELQPTVIGELVRDAAFYRAAGNAHSIMLSRRTYDLLPATVRGAFPLTPKTLVKPGKLDQLRVYELDALYDQAGHRKAAVEALRGCAELKRLNNRWEIPERAVVQLMTPLGMGTLHDISRGGVALALSQALTEGRPIPTKVVTFDEMLKTRLAYRGLAELSAEVRWSRPHGPGRLHGLQWLNLDEDTKDFLLQCILEAQSGYG